MVALANRYLAADSPCQWRQPACSVSPRVVPRYDRIDGIIGVSLFVNILRINVIHAGIYFSKIITDNLSGVVQDTGWGLDASTTAFAGCSVPMPSRIYQTYTDALTSTPSSHSNYEGYTKKAAEGETLKDEAASLVEGQEHQIRGKCSAQSVETAPTFTPAAALYQEREEKNVREEIVE